ncbi:hypothetical protein ACQP00_21215 [Dactylosporangium sp. CS-047395]|uniref:hypothetical protein n=1 Tax=Dactylosporangium sp. CS-047395 TaxID=3239936 RepID=UPI003D8B0F64
MPLGAVHTCIGYGYPLGGPGAWNLRNVPVGGALDIGWFDETVPTLTFERGAITELAARLGFRSV